MGNLVWLVHSRWKPLGCSGWILCPIGWSWMVGQARQARTALYVSFRSRRLSRPLSRWFGEALSRESGHPSHDDNKQMHPAHRTLAHTFPAVSGNYHTFLFVLILSEIGVASP